MASAKARPARWWKVVLAAAFGWTLAGTQASAAPAGQTSSASEVRLARPPLDRPASARFAVIINGDAGEHHVGNCLDAYGALKTNGFTDDEIFLLSSEPRIGSAAVPTLGPNDGPPNPRNLTAVFNFLRDEVRPSDTLVVYVTGHGGSDTPKSDRCFIELVPREKDRRVAPANQLALRDFLASVSAIRPRRALFLFDQCYGQAFATSLAGKGPFISIALSTKAEEVYCQNFSPVFWKELRRSGILRKPLPRTSLKAAFDKACRHARRRERTQKPILQTAPGVDAAKFFLWE
ncbi:MAG: caspase family protein [Candidatus Wallbacteria bacterium]|nr:caspase family protein [Candidatus Wallbacteria bacterium]